MCIFPPDIPRHGRFDGRQIDWGPEAGKHNLGSGGNFRGSGVFRRASCQNGHVRKHRRNSRGRRRSRLE